MRKALGKHPRHADLASYNWSREHHDSKTSTTAQSSIAPVKVDPPITYFCMNILFVKVAVATPTPYPI